VTQPPLPLHTRLAPHEIPAGLLALSVQIREPVEQEFVPFLQGLAGWQAVPDVHEMHCPLRQTRLAPQAVPSVRG
jgi:hypothetical protein